MEMNDPNKQIEELSFEDLTFGEQTAGEISFDSQFHHHQLPSHHHQPISISNHHIHQQQQQQQHHQHQHHQHPQQHGFHQQQQQHQHQHQYQQQQHQQFNQQFQFSLNNNNTLMGTTPPGSNKLYNTQLQQQQQQQQQSNGKPIIKSNLLNTINSINNNSNSNGGTPTIGSNNNTPTKLSSGGVLGTSGLVEKRNKLDKSDRHAVLISSKGDKINLALLLKLLEECGSVRAHHFRERQNFGFVQFLDTDSADNAINKLNNRDVDGQILTVERIKRITPGKDPRISSVGSPQCSSLPTTLPSMIENKPDSTLVLKNLPFNLKQVQLQEILEAINPSAPQSVNFHFDNIGVFRGMAFVKYRLVEDAVKVFDALNGTDVHGRRVRLEYKRKVSKSSEIPQEVLEDEALVKVLEQLKEFRDDQSQNEITFSSFTGVQRMYIHNMAEKFKLNHTSIGEEPNRSIIVTKKDPNALLIPPNLALTPTNTISGSGSIPNSNIMNSSGGFSTTPTSSFLSSSPQILSNLSSLLLGSTNNNTTTNNNNNTSSSNPNSIQNSLSTTPTGTNVISNQSSSTPSNNFNSTIGFNIPIINTNSNSNTNNNSKPINLKSPNNNSNNNTTTISPNSNLSQSPSFLNFITQNSNSNNNNNNLIINDSKIGTSWEKSPGGFFSGRIHRDRSYSASSVSTSTPTTTTNTSDVLSTSPNWKKFDSPNSNNNSSNNSQNINNPYNLLNSSTNTPNNSFSNSFNFSNNFNLNSNISNNNNNNSNIFIPTAPLSSINSSISNLLNNNQQQQQLLLHQQQQLQQQQQQQQQLQFQQQLQQQSFNLSSPTRQPKGPDGTKGFSDDYKNSRKLGQSPLASPAN